MQQDTIRRVETENGIMYLAPRTGRIWADQSDAAKDNSGEWHRVYCPALAANSANPHHPTASAYRWERIENDDDEKEDREQPERPRARRLYRPRHR